MSTRNYPPPEIINPPAMDKKNYEHIILWMLYNNNEECEWSDFLQSPLQLSTSTLSRHLKILMHEEFITKVSKGHYEITSEGKRRFHDLSKVKEDKRILNFPPEIILKNRNYDHWILWMVYNNNFCKWSDFLEDPVSINQSSLSKTMRLLMKNGFVQKEEENREYRITQLGKSEYARILQFYDLDRQTILEEESKRIEEITKKTINFFTEHKITDKKIQFRFLNNMLKLDYNRVKAVLRNEEDFHKILLYLSINHPNQYPNHISPEDFSKIYDVKENTLTYYIDEIVENNIYPLKFFKIIVTPGIDYYFQEDEKLETMMRAITEDYITESTYLNKLFARSLNISVIINDISEEICKILLNKNLKEALKEFLPYYINYLAYKIEAEKGLTEISDKLEGIIWQNMSSIFQTESNENLENQYKEELEEINKAIENNPKMLELYNSKMGILIYFNQFDEVQKLLDGMLKIFPNNEKEIKIKKASVLKRIKKVKAGLNIINELIQKYPEDEELLVYKAYWLQYLNQKEESLMEIRNLIELKPNNGIYHDTYGEILMYFEEYQEAVIQFQQAIELAMNEWFINQTYIKLGVCYKELGDYELAVEFIRKGKKITESSAGEMDINQKWNKIADIFLSEIEES